MLEDMFERSLISVSVCVSASEDVVLSHVCVLVVLGAFTFALVGRRDAFGNNRSQHSERWNGRAVTSHA